MADVLYYLGYDEANLGQQKSVPVRVINGGFQFSQPLGDGTDRSTTAGTANTQFMAANPTRAKFYIKNDGTVDIWIRPASPAVATAGGGNIKVPANGGYFELAGSTSSWNVISGGAATPFTAREF